MYKIQNSGELRNTKKNPAPNNYGDFRDYLAKLQNERYKFWKLNVIWSL